MPGWPQSWEIRSSFYDEHIVLWRNLEAGPSDPRAVPGEVAAMAVSTWILDPHVHGTLTAIYLELEGPGILPLDELPDIPLSQVAARLARAFQGGELVLLREPRRFSELWWCKDPVPPPPPEIKTWIRIRVVHGRASGPPVMGRAYELTLPDGRKLNGTLSGSDIHVTDIDPGLCSIKFPHAAPPVNPGPRPGQPPGTLLSWKAYWDMTEAKAGDARHMILEAPDLADGTVVTFSVDQQTETENITKSAPIGQKTAVIQGGKASADWTDWFHPDSVPARISVGLGQSRDSFPPVRFTFKAAHESRIMENAVPCRYGDTLRIQLMATYGASEESLGLCQYVLDSPWGTYMGRTDEKGHLVVTGLPPGGGRILVGGRLASRY